MSRLPQPSSRTDPRSRLKSTPTVPSPSVRASVSPLAKPRTRTPTTAPSPSPTLRVPPTPTLRTQKSAQTLRARTPTTPAKSPARKVRPLPPEDDVPPTPAKPQLSIREQIALKRAEVKKVTKSPVVGEFEGLENASPHTYNQPVEVDVDLGRWSIKETIERARSSGMSMTSFLVQTCQTAVGYVVYYRESCVQFSLGHVLSKGEG